MPSRDSHPGVHEGYGGKDRNTGSESNIKDVTAQ